MYADVN